MDELAAKKAQLEQAFEAAQTRVGELSRNVAEAAAARHEALVAADFNTSDQHHKTHEDAKAALAPAQAALEALRAAIPVVAAKIQRQEHLETRDRLVDSIAASSDEMRSLLVKARKQVLDSHAALTKAHGIEQDVVRMEFDLGTIRVALGEIERAPSHVRERFVTEALGSAPALALVANLSAADLRPIQIPMGSKR